jgi:hypothetical protein
MPLPAHLVLLNPGLDAVARANGRALHMPRHELALRLLHGEKVLDRLSGDDSFPIVKASPIVDKA